MADATDSAARAYWQSHPKRKIACATCGETFETKSNAILYCRRECDQSEDKSKHRRSSPRSEDQRMRVCEQCGASFVESTKLSASQVAAGGQRFCSIECARRKRPRIYPDERTRRRAEGTRRRSRQGVAPLGSIFCVVCGDLFLQKSINHIVCGPECRKKYRTEKRRPHLSIERKCKECGAAFKKERTNSGRTSFCSERCSKKHNKRVHRKAAKARLRGVSVESVDPIRVFERDGWRCHLCGRKTPQERRGTYHKRAPELDHIVPLAKGGEHSYRNTACACRECNAAKRDTVKGQPSLLVA